MGHEGLLSPQLRVFAGSVLGALLAWVLVLLRTHRLTLRDSLIWFVSSLLALVLVLFDGALVLLARTLGAELPSNALFAVGFVYVLLNLLVCTIAVSGTAAQVRRLTQECALLRGEIDGLRGQLEEGAAGGERRASPPAPPRP
jgi:hypothetical protein